MSPAARFTPGAVLIALAFVVAGCLSGCVSPTPPSPSPPASSWCVPRIFVEPAVVAPGETITMSSDTTCDLPQPSGGWSVLVGPVGHPDEGVRTTVNDNFDGSFNVSVALPLDFPTGEAFAAIENWDYSACNDTRDTTSSRSCASASGSFTVE